jgi:hypothetical protein
MSLPQIKIETINATMDKMMQDTPTAYIGETLHCMVEDGNEELASCLAFVGKTLMDEMAEVDTGGLDSESLGGFAAEFSLAYASMVYRIMKSQIEANELNEAWDKVGLE